MTKSDMDRIVFLTAGERCVTVSFGDEVSLELNAKVRALREQLELEPVEGVTETVPTYCALSVHFEPKVIRRKELEKALSLRIRAMKPAAEKASAVKEVPVCYGKELGPDLEACAAFEGISPEELIRKHTEHPYYVFQLGFSPGHPYMARFEEPFSFGRRETPRLSIPEHSVVAQKGLTNITPFSQSCGWSILGSTPLTVTDYNRPEPFFFQAGDWVKLKPVAREEFERIRKENQVLEEIQPLPEQTQVLPAEKKGIEVLAPGALTTVQDEGRYGYQASGVTPAGPMDHRAFHLANLLAGNRRGEAALEITLSGPVLKFHEEAVIVLTGADLSPRLNGNAVSMYSVLTVHPEDLLEFGRRKNGCRTYMAVRGGIDVPIVLGSRSTDLKNRLGGYMGRALKAGDRLPVGSISKEDESGKEDGRRKFSCTEHSCPEYRCNDNERNTGGILWSRYFQTAADREEIVLRVVCGPQADRFTKKGKRDFFNYRSVISNNSDRQGIRLERESLEFVTDANIISDGIPMGAVQVPGDGKPIILLADRQSVGGYAKIGTVIYSDLPALAQALPGCSVRFVEVSPGLAEELYLKEQRELDRLEGKDVQY